MTTDQIVELAIRERALQRRGELALLVDLVREMRPARVLEIGTCHGGTLAAWCQCAAPDALIVSIDLPGGEFGGKDARVHDGRMLGFRREGQDLRFYSKDSHEPLTLAAVAPLFHPEGVDFLFIDGDHTYKGVEADFMDYSSLVRPGGLIAFHDIAENPDDDRCGVPEFWADLKASWKAHRDEYRLLEIRTDGDYAGCGIGVIRWTG